MATIIRFLLSWLGQGQRIIAAIFFTFIPGLRCLWDSSFEFGFDDWFYGMKNSFFWFLHPVCLGVLRTLGFYINSRQLAINGH